MKASADPIGKCKYLKVFVYIELSSMSLLARNKLHACFLISVFCNVILYYIMLIALFFL